MFSWLYSWFSPDQEETIVKNEEKKIVKKNESIYYMSQLQLDQQIQSLKKIRTVCLAKHISNKSPFEMINKFAVSDILNQKKNKTKIHEEKDLSVEERREKVKLYFEKIKKEKEYEEEMNKILNSPVLRRENREKINEYFKNKKFL